MLLAATTQVSEVKSNLGAGMPMLEADNRIVLDKTGSYIENKRSGSRIKVNHEGGSFTFDFWVPAGSGQVPRAGQAPRNTKVSNKYQALDMDVDEDNEMQEVDRRMTVFVGQEIFE